MRKITRQITAVLAAAVMTVSAAGSVSAQGAPQGSQQESSAKYTGWLADGSGWKYVEDGKSHAGDKVKIGGEMCSFSLNGHYIGGYSGWVKDRCYKEGLPFTGWTDNGRSNEYYREYYCVDGFKITGDLNIGDKIYSFGQKGVYRGKNRAAGITVSCAEKVSSDTEELALIIENIGGKNREIEIAQSFEYLKNGKWESCKKGRVSYSKLDDPLLKKGEKRAFEVDVQKLSRNKFDEGFYRLPVECGGETYYAVFEAVSPIELKVRQDEYVIENYYGYNRNSPASITAIVDFDLKINSVRDDMQARTVAKNVKVKIERQTADGWKAVDGKLPDEIGYTEDESTLFISSAFTPTVGYYRATVTLGETKCSDRFFICCHTVEAWLDEYDLNDKDITVCFDVLNRGREPIEICAFPYGLYKKDANGAWQPAGVEGAAVEIPSDAYAALDGGQKTTVGFALSEYYNTSELTAGEYAVDIGGVGLAEFTLTDKPKERNFPFKDLKAEDIREIQIEDLSCDLDNTAVLTNGSGEVTRTDVTDEYNQRKITAQVPDSYYFNNAVCYIRQLEFTSKGKNPDNIDPLIGGGDRTKIILKDGSEIFLNFNGASQVVYDGKLYYCSKYTCDALSRIAEKFTQRNLPYDDIYENEPVQMELELIDGSRVVIAELNESGDLHSLIVYAHYFELKEVCENYEMPTGGAFDVTFIYKDGTRETLAFLEPDIVRMPDGKFYRCYDDGFYTELKKVFDGLEHTVGSIYPDDMDELEEDTT